MKTCKHCLTKLHSNTVKRGLDKCRPCRINERMTIYKIRQLELGQFVGTAVGAAVGLALWRNFYMGRNT